MFKDADSKVVKVPYAVGEVKIEVSAWRRNSQLLIEQRLVTPEQWPALGCFFMSMSTVGPLRRHLVTRPTKPHSSVATSQASGVLVEMQTHDCVTVINHLNQITLPYVVWCDLLDMV